VAQAPSADAITLSLPHARAYHGVARLVVGGLAARLELSYENLEDLQLALESVLERDGYVRGDRVTVRLLVGDESVVLEIGPLDPAELRQDLERPAADRISLARLLSTLVDEVSLEERGDGHLLRLEKRVSLARPEAREPA
jgi:hypothetical protein